MAMKCPSCGTENPEDKKFCGDCGSRISKLPMTKPMGPPTSPGRRNWWRSNWKVLAAVIITIVIVLPTASAVFTQPWSKIRVKYVHDSPGAKTMVYGLYLDGRPIFAAAVHSELQGMQIVLVQLSVAPGRHIVGLDYNFTTESTFAFNLDGLIDRSLDVQVNPFSVADVPIYLSTL